jgi:transglutaminase-like putative cysteine protease
MDLDAFRGTVVFGRAYQFMLEHDTHATGSADREIVDATIRLCPETAEYLYRAHTPLDVGYVRGSRLQLEAIVSRCLRAAASTEEQVSAIARFTRGLGQHAEQDLDEMQVGGTEEQIVERGTNWCTDVARVACVLYQIAGFPCRIVHLFDLDQAYSGHVVVEVHRAGVWGAVDSNTGVVYRHAKGTPATTWDLMNDPSLVLAHQGPGAWYTSVGQFRAAGISNYFCWEAGKYDYTISGLNEYYLAILTMADQHWPGGLRWLYGEDNAQQGDTASSAPQESVDQERTE